VIQRSFALDWQRSLRTLTALGALSLGASAAQAQSPAPSTAAAPAAAPVTAAPTLAPAPYQTTSIVNPVPHDTVASPATVTPMGAPVSEPANEPFARLDYSDGSFFLRSVNDNMIFVPGARAHIDVYSFGGSGVSDYQRANGTGLKTNLFFRRFVLEFGGIIRKKWFYWLGGNFAPTTVDGNQAPLSTANVYDGFVGYLPTDRIRVYFGMYNAPFTMENTTSSRWLDMMERALVVRTLATPYNKAEGLMVWGETEHKHFEYQAGIFGGDGMNRPNVDNRADGMVRLVVRPLATRSDALKRFHVGGGARLGWRDKTFTQYDAPALSTPGGYQFWQPSYTADDGAKIHVLTAGRQAAASGEFYLPFERWDVRGEVVYINENRHEVAETNKARGLRSGLFSGYGGYLQGSFWLAGSPRISGNPAGLYGVTKMPTGPGNQYPFALQLVARAEIMRMNYDANKNAGADAGKLSAKTNNIDVNAYQLGLNYWATRHIRLTAEYSLYQFLGSSDDNQAVAPGVKSKKALDANVLHEVSFRCGLAI
jgi:phosphate-selective porin